MIRAFWQLSTDWLESMHPLDAFADGTGHEISINDRCFVGNIDDFLIYSFRGYEVDNSAHNPPYAICGTDVGDGYPVWRVVSFGYTYQCHEMSTDYTGTMYCTDSDDRGELCSLFNSLTDTEFLCPSYRAVEVQTYSSNLFNINSLTQADWEVLDTGVTPVFTPERLEPSGVPAPAGDFDVVVDFGEGSLVAVAVGDMGKGELNAFYVMISGNYLGAYLRVLSADKKSWSGAYTVKLSIQRNAIAMLPHNLRTSITTGGWNNDTIVVGVNWDGTSKPDAGCIAVLRVASDLSVSLVGYVDTIEAGTRNGHFGTFVAIGKVTDTTHGADHHIFGADIVNENVYVFSENQGFVHVQTLPFDGGDIFQMLSADEDLLVVHYQKDSDSYFYARSYTFDGSTWAQAGERNLGLNLGSGNGGVKALGNNRWLLFDSIDNRDIRLYNSTMVLAALKSLPTTQCYVGSDIHRQTLLDNSAIWCRDEVTDSIRVFEFDVINDTIDQLCNTVGGAILSKTPDYAQLIYDSDNALCYLDYNECYYMEAPQGKVCDIGLFSVVSANANTRYVVGDDIVGLSGLLDFTTNYSGAKIKWGISTDNKATWRYWDGITWIVFDPVTETGGFDSFIDNGLQALDPSIIDQIDFCLQISITSNASVGNVGIVSVDCQDDAGAPFIDCDYSQGAGIFSQVNNLGGVRLIYSQSDTKPRIVFFDTLR